MTTTLSERLVRELLRRPNLAAEVRADPRWHARIISAYQREQPVGPILLRIHDGLCRRQARRWHALLGSETADVYQEARIAVLAAAQRYEPRSRSDPFKYIASCVRWAGSRYFERHGSVVRLPMRSGEKKHRVHPFSNLPASVFAASDSRDGFEDGIRDDGDLADDVIGEEEIVAACKRILAVAFWQISPNGELVLRSRYWDGKTLDGTAESLPYGPRSREQVRQIELRALERLRGFLNTLAQKGLRPRGDGARSSGSACEWPDAGDFAWWLAAIERGLAARAKEAA